MCLYSIKGISKSASDILFEYKDAKFSSFIDVIKTIPLDKTTYEALIKLDYFTEFGKSAKLLVIYNLYRTKTSIGYSLKSIEMKPVNIGSLEINFKYYYNTCQNKTLCISEFIMNKGILSEVFKEELFDNDLKILCLGCEKILRERKKEKSHISSMIINASKEKTWNSITDLNKKRYIIKLKVANLKNTLII